MAFEELSVKELKVVAEEFAVELNGEEKTHKLPLCAAIEASGVSFTDWLKNHPDQWERFNYNQDGVDDSGETSNQTEPDKEVSEVTKEDRFVIKMERDNPYYEIGKYSFSEENPYALVSAGEVEEVLAVEGFRQATPAELRDFFS